MVTPSDPFHDNVSVIVLNYNQAETTLECLDALSRARGDLIREIEAVDNGSNPGELAVLRNRHRRGGFSLVEVGENRFFSEGNNIGVDFAHGDYIVFLNNDAFVQPGWIEALATMRDDPTVAAVGPCSCIPTAGCKKSAVFAPDRRRRADRQGSGVGTYHYDTPCLVDYCSAACFMIRRRVFFKVGGLGLEWEPAY